jgi:tetratricopeptide (TPR) repeat protein
VNRLILAKGLAYLGMSLDHSRQAAESEASFREAMGLLEGLVAQAPKVAQYREEHASCVNALGELMRDLGRNGEAEALFRDAAARFEKLVADVPNNPHYGAELGVAETDLAEAMAGRGEFKSALEQLERAKPRIDLALKANPDRADYHPMIRSNRRLAAQYRARLGEAAAALELAESIARLGLDAAADHFASARALAACAPSPRRDDPQHFADRAMRALRQAIAAGFRDTRALREKQDLDPLRNRADFELLTMDLEFPTDAFAPSR